MDQKRTYEETIEELSLMRMYLTRTPDKELNEQFDFRCIRPEEADQSAAIEQICFPPHEMCSERTMRERVETGG